jgi:hypothetical protein
MADIYLDAIDVHRALAAACKRAFAALVQAAEKEDREP